MYFFLRHANKRRGHRNYGVPKQKGGENIGIFNSRKEHVARCPTIRSIACTNLHAEHSAYRKCKQLLITFQTHGNTSIHPQHGMFYFIWLFISSAQDPRPLLALTFDCLLAICPAPPCSFSWNLYLLSLSCIYSFLNPLLSMWACYSLYFHTPFSHTQRAHLYSSTFYPRFSPCKTLITSILHLCP